MCIARAALTVFFDAFCAAVIWEQWNNTAKWGPIDYIFALLVLLLGIGMWPIAVLS